MVNKPSVLVLTGDGINCQLETAQAFKLAGGEVKTVHVNDLLENRSLLHKYSILALPGGFSFGDEIGSGQILALKLRYGLAEELDKFVKGDKLIIGICNGFQTLAKLGILPSLDKERSITLGKNDSGCFINCWADLKTNNASKCIWTQNLPKEFRLPIRHGEGKIVIRGDFRQQQKIYRDMDKNGQIVLKYQIDVNGSYEKVAGICDPSGRIFGLMPHPEAATNMILDPRQKNKKLEEGVGMSFFSNAINYFL